jgi:hypothetical protein
VLTTRTVREGHVQGRHRRTRTVTVRRGGALVRGSFEEVVLESVIRSYPGFRIVIKHAQNQVLELEIFAGGMARFAGPPAPGTPRVDAEDVVQSSRPRQLVLLPVFRLLQHVPSVAGQLLEELPRLVGLVEETLGRHPQHLDDLVHLVDLVGAAEERLAGVHLHQDAPQRPHVDRQVVGDAEQHLRGPVEPRLDVLVYLKGEQYELVRRSVCARDYPLSQLARTPEIDDLYGRAFRIAQEDVLGLQIAMDDVQFWRREEQ